MSIYIILLSLIALILSPLWIALIKDTQIFKGKKLRYAPTSLKSRHMHRRWENAKNQKIRGNQMDTRQK